MAAAVELLFFGGGKKDDPSAQTETHHAARATDGERSRIKLCIRSSCNHFLNGARLRRSHNFPHSLAEFRSSGHLLHTHQHGSKI